MKIVRVLPIALLAAACSEGGPTTAPEVELNAEFASMAAPQGMVSGWPYYLAVTVKNTGTQPWTPSSGIQVSTRAEGFTIDMPVTETVAPGTEILLDTVITAPAVGTRGLRWQLRQGAAGWFGAQSELRSIVVHPVHGLAAEYVSQTVPASMKAGQEYDVEVRMKNTGPGSWLGNSTFLLGAQNPMDNSTWGRSRVQLTADVAPGQTAVLAFRVRAPATPGTYNFRWGMLVERVSWFGPLTPNLSVTVNP